MKTYRYTILLFLFLMIHNGMCNHAEPASVSGVCNSFEAPERRIAGKTKADQRWIDKTIERGVAVCHWRRPGAPK